MSLSLKMYDNRNFLIPEREKVPPCQGVPVRDVPAVMLPDVTNLMVFAFLFKNLDSFCLDCVW